MKKLNVHFADKQHLQVDDLINTTGLKFSQVARAALQLGLKQIRESKDGFSLVLINDAKARN